MNMYGGVLRGGSDQISQQLKYLFGYFDNIYLDSTKKQEATQNSQLLSIHF